MGSLRRLTVRATATALGALALAAVGIGPAGAAVPEPVAGLPRVITPLASAPPSQYCGLVALETALAQAGSAGVDLRGSVENLHLALSNTSTVGDRLLEEIIEEIPEMLSFLSGTEVTPTCATA